MAYWLRLVAIALTSCLLIVPAAQLDDPAVNLPGCHITIVFPRHSLRIMWLLWGHRNCRRVEPRLRRGRGFMTHRLFIQSSI